MKKILIATDFSPASGNALLYGTKLAAALNATVILFHAYQLPHPFPSAAVSISKYGLMVEMKQQLEDEAKRILQEDSSAIETVCEVGDPKAAIISIVKEKNADLVITGMKGAGKNIKKVFGSVATSLTSGIQVPVLIVPEEASFNTPDVIVFASDGGGNPLREDLDKFKDIKDSFHSKLYVVHVIKKDETQHLRFSENSEEEKYLDISFEFPVDADISHGLDEFIKKHDVQMLVMMPHKHDWAERLFHISETKDMIFHTHIPLLILPDMFS